MFDLERYKLVIAEHYFKVFRVYKNPELSDQFIRRWLQLLLIYSKLPNFVSFHTTVPIIDRLYPNARAVLVVPFSNTKIPFLLNVSIFPLYPFKVILRHKSVCCREGLELLKLYLKLTGIQLVGFYQILNYKNVIKSLNMPELHFYPPKLFKYFCKISKTYGTISDSQKFSSQHATSTSLCDVCK